MEANYQEKTERKIRLRNRMFLVFIILDIILVGYLVFEIIFTFAK